MLAVNEPAVVLAAGPGGPGREHRRQASGVKNSTAARKLTAASSFCAWCARRGNVRANPVADLAPTGVIARDLILTQLATPSREPPDTMLNWGFHEPACAETLLPGGQY